MLVASLTSDNNVGNVLHALPKTPETSLLIAFFVQDVMLEELHEGVGDH